MASSKHPPKNFTLYDSSDLLRVVSFISRQHQKQLPLRVSTIQPLRSTVVVSLYLCVHARVRAPVYVQRGVCTRALSKSVSTSFLGGFLNIAFTMA